MLHEELVGDELFYDVSFEEVINWFMPCYLGICKEAEMPPTLHNGKPVNLITLYQVVKDYGGFKKVIEDDAWKKIAVQCGFDCKDAQEVKIVYVSEEHETGSSKVKNDERVKVEVNEDEPDLVIILEVTGRKDE
ncbi:putative transcription factor & chromatin remodeling ARID family [Helianthus anomalus]